MEILTETVKVIVETIVGYTIGAVGRQMDYLISYKKNVENLSNKVDDLEDARKSVEHKVEAARMNVEEIDAKVLRWQTRFEGITEEVQKFFKEEGQAKLKCFDLKARYQLGKRAHKMGLAVKELKDTADTFDTVGHRVPMRGGTTSSTKGYEDFESRKSTLNGIMRALKDDSIHAIGVYGMGGVGKTMLVGKIATQAKEDDLFERIVKVVVSQTPDLEKIQKEIAKELGLSFQDDETDSQKANLLSERLKTEKILLIIDDIWNKIDLESRGISFGDDQKGSKLLLTSRFRDVLGTDMDTQEIFSVGALSDDEAKYLFSKIVGDLVENLNFQSIMVELVEECAGLPIAITTVANALKSQKNPNVWKDAVQQLKRANPTQIKDMHKMVYSSIKLSYDFLTKEAQSLFLFGSIFEEDKVIEIDLLWRYLVGLDFFEDVYKMEEVRNRVHTLVNRLKDSCLLLEGNGSGTFKMHDVIRDVAINIADKEEKMLTIRSLGGPETWLNMKKWEGSFGIALFDVDFEELPERFGCPQLKFIFLRNKGYLRAPIPNIVFEGMKELRVLVLINASLPHLSSISCLHNLQSLFLDGCELEDVALIGELKNLRALTLSRSNIKQLPMEIRQLTHLQLLNLNYCTKLEVIPSNVFSDLRGLEELYMNCSFNQWHVDGEITERNNTRVSELDHLPLLTTLYIHIPNPKILPKALLFENLKKYKILIGNSDWDDYEEEEEEEDEDFNSYWDSYWDRDNDGYEFESSRTLKLRLDRGFQIEDGIKVLWKSCEYLDLIPWEGIKNIIYEADKEVFPQLKCLYVQNSTEIQYLVNFMEFQGVAFPVLQLLSLDKMKNLEEICHDQVTMGSFLSLKKLRVSKCEKLTFVFSTMFGCFSQLQEIVIKDCKVMRAIFSKEGTHEIQVNHDTNIIDFTQLRCLYLRNLPNLVGFHPDADSQLLFNEKVAFSNLEEIYIKGVDNLKMLWHNHQLVPDSFCKIKKLHVFSCENLMNIFPPNMLRRLQNLEVLKIEDCDSVEEVFEVREENVDEICDKGSSQLTHMTLNNLPKLKHVWTSDPEAILAFQKMRRVEVSKCETLKSLFPISVAKSLEQLESLRIIDCELMEEIVALEEGSETMTKFVFPQITSLTLQSLPELKCFYPGKHTSEWPSLKSLMIHKCDKVKIVVPNELSFSNIDGSGHHVPVQQPLFPIEKVAFSNLEDIHISDEDTLKMLWHNYQLVPDSFCKLKKLGVARCKNLMNIFPPNMLRRLQNLEELEIRDCNLIEEVFDIRGVNVDEICDSVSIKLRVLRLFDLPKLKHVWSSDLQAILTFPNLHTIEVFNCKSLKSLFPVSMAKSLEQLKWLTIRDCGLEEIVAMEEGSETVTKFVFPQLRSLNLQSLLELKCLYQEKHTSEWPSLNLFSNLEYLHIDAIYKLKMLWHNQLVPDSFRKLKQLHVDNCENLIIIFQPNILRRLQNLEDLQIRNCNLVEEVFEVRGENVDEICDMVSTQFKVLKLINLPKLKHVWSMDRQAILTFKNLHEVEVSNCKSMKSLFPASVAKSLEQLERLKIHDCGLEEIVAMEEGSEIVTKFVFPRLLSLILELMPDLKCFYPGKHTLTWPSLKHLTIHKCDKVKIVTLNELSFLDTDGLGHHVPAQQPFLLFEKVVFSNLEDICISDIDNLKMLWHNHQLVPDSFCKLKKLRVGRCKNLMNTFLPNMLRRLQNLEELEIRDCNFVEEVFDIRGVNIDEICDTVSNKLRVLRLFDLPKLKHVWNSDLQAILTFQNLREVEVSNCKSLKSLFPFSVAKSLEQLKMLEIQDCGLEEIVAMEEGSETMTKFVFPRITSLWLQSLPELKCFYPGKHTSEWLSLNFLYISKCDKVNIFASNELSFSDTDKLGHHVPVQQPLFLIEKVGFPNLEDIYINDMDNLKMLWHNHQLVLDSFCKLKELDVRRCKNLTNIFPPNMLRRLQNLEELEKRDCNSVEEVFDIRGVNVDEICDTVSTRLRVLRLFNLPKLEHVWSSDCQAILTFQNLCEVEVFNCKSLKSFFPILVAKSCEQLKSLTIGNCGLEEIVAMEEGVETTIKFVFPRITSLYLESLPELKYFYPGKHTSEWPSLKRLTIHNCNKVKIIASNELSFQERDELVHHVQVQQPLFPIEKDILSNLEELKLDWDDTINQTYDQLKAQFSCKLKVLRLYSKDRWTAFPWVFVQGLYNLKKLDISNFFLEEICPCGIVDNEGQYAEMFERLTTLHLSKMPKLMHLWKENSQQGMGIQNLESLHVSECGRLKNLLPSSMYFRNLNTLEVSKCHGLISLATSSTVKSLVQLKRLTISKCKRMREMVISEGEGEAGDEICFNQLNYLSLYDLPTLGSVFQLGNRTIKFPSLQYLHVNRCPELKIFSNGVLIMPKLHHFGLDGNYWSKYQTDLLVEDLNTFLKRCWEKNNVPCLRQLFTQKTNASTSEVGEENDVDDLENDSM